MTALTFNAPRKGPWNIDLTHVPRPAPRIFAEVFPPAMKQATLSAFARYGSGVEFLEVAAVNGFGYLRPRPVGAPEGATKPPPGFVMKLMFALHPELRRRRKTARTLFVDKPWRDDLDRWDRVVRPASIKAHRALQSVALDPLDDTALVEHLKRCIHHCYDMIVQHHSFDTAAIVPVGDFLAQASDWTGAGTAELTQLLAGASPESAGDSHELSELRAAVAADDEARKLVFGEKGADEILAALSAWPGRVGQVVRDGLDLISYRLADGIDPGHVALREAPALLLLRLRALFDPPRAASRHDERIAAVRDRVPEASRAEFDALLAEARHMCRLRDERGLYSDIWAWGIFRAVVLHAGERLTKRGRIAKASDLIEAGQHELEALILGQGGPTADELSERAALRARASLAEAPPFLNSPVPPAPLDHMPPDIRRVERAIVGYLDCMFNDCTEEARPEVSVRGLAVSPGVYTGTARVILHPSELDLIQKGEILVTTATSAAFNVALPLLGAIVTDRGGTLSHAAIVAREFGIPAVVGCREATRKITTGARLEVDGARGEARLV